MIENNKVVDAKAWIKKYLSDASEENKFLWLAIRGINDIKLISKPIHAPSHELDEIEIIVPPIKVDRKRVFVGLLCIKKKRNNYLYKWDMNPLA